MRVMDKVRVALWDPTEKGVKAREDVSDGLAWAKPGCAVGVAFGVAGVALGVFAMVNYPVIGCLIGVSSALYGVISREGFIVAENLEKVLQTITSAAKGSITESSLAHELLKNTWFCERIFSSLLIQQLKKPA